MTPICLLLTPGAMSRWTLSLASYSLGSHSASFGGSTDERCREPFEGEPPLRGTGGPRRRDDARPGPLGSGGPPARPGHPPRGARDRLARQSAPVPAVAGL